MVVSLIHATYGVIKWRVQNFGQVVLAWYVCNIDAAFIKQ